MSTIESNEPSEDEGRLTTTGRYRLARVTLQDLRSKDPLYSQLLEVAERVARTDLSVLLLGETGTGKNLLAQAIHNASDRRKKGFVEVTCGAITESVAESELFGHAAGAYTDARREHRGWLERADGGTIFFDEIGDLSPRCQGALLRVVEKGEFYRIGDEELRRTNVRVVTATTKDLIHEVATGRFREDLYHRLVEQRLFVPPLRARRHDVLPLAERLLAEACKKRRMPALTLERACEEKLLSHNWPGNVRELRSVMRAAASRASSISVRPEDIVLEILDRTALAEAAPVDLDLSLASAEKHQIERALLACGGNKTRAAQALGIARNTLDRKIRELRIEAGRG